MLKFYKRFLLICLFGLLQNLSPVAVQAEFTPAAVFFHANDTYRVGAVENLRRGGLGRVATKIREAKQRGLPVIFLHAGDFLFPSLESEIWKGIQMVKALNFLQELVPTFVVPGNHEFDKKEKDALVNAVQASKFKWIGSNVKFKTGQDDIDNQLVDTAMIDLGGKKVGLFGLTLHEDDGGKSRKYAEIKRSYLGEARRAIKSLELLGADIIIALTHLDRPIDDQVAALRKEHPKLVWVAGGHEHTNQEGNLTLDQALVTKGDSNARSIWEVEIGINEKGETEARPKLIVLNEQVNRDPEFRSQISDHYAALLESKLPFIKKRIGVAAVPLDGREETVRQRESNWGNYLADIMRTSFPEEPMTQFAVLNGGSLRIDDYIEGNITFEDVFRTFGFPTYIRNIKISGKNFKEKILSHGLGASKPSPGRFLQIAGFRMCFHRTSPGGGTLLKAEYSEKSRWVNIEDSATYTVAVNDYMYDDGDLFKFQKDVLTTTPAGPDLKWLVIADILKKTKDGQPVYSPVNTAKKRIDSVSDPSHCFK